MIYDLNNYTGKYKMNFGINAKELDEMLSILSKHSSLNCFIFVSVYALYKITFKVLDKNFKCITSKIKFIYMGSK